MTVYINGAKVLDGKVSMEDLDELERLIRLKGFTISELARDGDNYEYTLRETITVTDIEEILARMEGRIARARKRSKKMF